MSKKVKIGGFCFLAEYLQTFDTLSKFKKEHPEVPHEIAKELYNDAKPILRKAAKPTTATDSD